MARSTLDHPVLHWQMVSVGLGRALVAWSTQGVCAVLLGDDDAAVLAELHQAFPDRVLQHDERPHPWVGAAQAELEEVRPHQVHRMRLPLDVGGTAFQQAVWSALRQIPTGQTVTYSELAQQLGRPGAVRAVASACAANVLAVLIPCHRVVRRDGSPSGYRWGLARKQTLLAREALR